MVRSLYAGGSGRVLAISPDRADLDPADLKRLLPNLFITYAARIALAYPRQPDGRTLLPFRRLFIVARR